MHAKSIVLVSGLGLFAFPVSTLFAAPVLQMHVYEEVPDQLPPANKVVGQAVEPQRLRVHIYESPQKIAEKRHPGCNTIKQIFISKPDIGVMSCAGIKLDRVGNQTFCQS